MLLPEHFTAEEDSYAAESDVRARLADLPSDGVAALEWSLSSSLVSIQSLAAVLELATPATAALRAGRRSRRP